MLLNAIVSAAFLAFGVNAAAIAAAGKSFKFQVNDPTKGKVFLAEAGLATADEAKALVCELSADVLKCGGKGFSDFKSGDMLKLSPSASGSSKGWTIDESDNILWKAQANVKFSIGIGSANDVYAETCPITGHKHGTAKAIYITV